MSADAESRRLAECGSHGVPWRKWGPYLSERQWGTVREDYSDNGDAWSYFTHDEARSRAYGWGEDGLAGFSDDQGYLCLALTVWNGVDPILKERLFGLDNAEGNHGEDVKEYYFYLDATPTHSYQRWLYKYPQRPFPYGDLVRTNRSRSRHEPEYELLDTGIFDDDRYFDVVVEYAKAAPEDVLMRVTAINRGPAAATLHLLPTLWFRDVWSAEPDAPRPRLQANGDARTAVLMASHRDCDAFTVECPTGSRRHVTLFEVAREISRRLAAPFLRDEQGRRPLFGAGGEIPARSALARPPAVLRVLPWRQRRRHRRQSPDRLDRTGRVRPALLRLRASEPRPGCTEPPHQH